MRGRRPDVLSLVSQDRQNLQPMAHSDSLPWYQVRRARIVLAMAAGERKCVLAARMGCGSATVWRTCERYRPHGLEGLLVDDRHDRSGSLEQITPLQRAQIVELACLEPIAKGLHVTPWSSEDLARQAVDDGIVAAISPATVRRILHNVDGSYCVSGGQLVSITLNSCVTDTCGGISSAPATSYKCLL